MDNASLILQTLDEHLDHPVRLILYGRAALQLGFENPPSGVAQSKDVDCIIPLSDLEPLTADMGFWDAQQATNDKKFSSTLLRASSRESSNNSRDARTSAAGTSDAQTSCRGEPQSRAARRVAPSGSIP